MQQQEKQNKRVLEIERKPKPEPRKSIVPALVQDVDSVDNKTKWNLGIKYNDETKWLLGNCFLAFLSMQFQQFRLNSSRADKTDKYLNKNGARVDKLENDKTKCSSLRD